MSTALCALVAYMQPPTVDDALPQCCVCNHIAEHKCAACGEQICEEHSRKCDFCEESRMPTLRYCQTHALEVEDRMWICEGHMPDLEAEMAAVLEAERVYEEVMA